MWKFNFNKVVLQIFEMQDFNKLRRTDGRILSENDFNISKVLLFGDHSFNYGKITSILVATAEYINFNKTF